MKNNENNKYSKTVEIINEKKSQISEHLISCHVDNHAAEESDHHDDEHKNKQKHIVHITDIIFNETDDDDCFTSVIKK